LERRELPTWPSTGLLLFGFLFLARLDKRLFLSNFVQASHLMVLGYFLQLNLILALPGNHLSVVLLHVLHSLPLEDEARVDDETSTLSVIAVDSREAELGGPVGLQKCSSLLFILCFLAHSVLLIL